MFKILGADQKEYGPVGADTLRQWIAERRADARTLVQVEGTTGWKPLSLFPEFSASLAGAPPPHTAPGAPAPVYVGPTGNNGMAVASLICGCVGLVCCQVTALPGLVMGIVALNQLKANPHQEGRGMAIAGIVTSCLGLVAFAVILGFGFFGAMLEEFGK